MKTSKKNKKKICEEERAKNFIKRKQKIQQRKKKKNRLFYSFFRLYPIASIAETFEMPTNSEVEAILVNKVYTQQEKSTSNEKWTCKFFSFHFFFSLLSFFSFLFIFCR